MKKKKYLITGSAGFVSKYFLHYLKSLKKHSSVLGLDMDLPAYKKNELNYLDVVFKRVNLLDDKKVAKIIDDLRPDYILHLASCSSVAYSWQYPNVSFQNNTNIFLNIVEAVRNCGVKTRILSVGSSEEYGNVHMNKAPITEECRLLPISPYAVARVAQEMLSRVYAESFGLDIIMTRSFNHIGPGQKDAFVVSSLVKQIVKSKQEHKSRVIIKAGDISIVRDFLDVRDVVRAYYLLLINGVKGETYNVCGGRGYSISDLIDRISKIIGLPITVEQDPKLIRPNDNKIIVGSNEKLKKELGWAQEIEINDTLRDMIDYWETAIGPEFSRVERS